jgi:hypothetical protein
MAAKTTVAPALEELRPGQATRRIDTQETPMPRAPRTAASADDNTAKAPETAPVAPAPPVQPAPVEKAESPDIYSGKRRMPDNFRKFLLKVQGGKYYLPAAYRIVWFRDECPDWGVETMLIEGGQEAGFATVQAKIFNSEGRVISSGIKTETRQDFPAGWVEKAETGAIARALAVAGFGTQFAPELDDDASRPADSPQSRPVYTPPRATNDGPRAETEREPRGGAPGLTRTATVSPNEVWAGPGLCPRCHAPEGKRHGKPCVI